MALTSKFDVTGTYVLCHTKEVAHMRYRVKTASVQLRNGGCIPGVVKLYIYVSIVC